MKLGRYHPRGCAFMKPPFTPSSTLKQSPSVFTARSALGKGTSALLYGGGSGKFVRSVHGRTSASVAAAPSQVQTALLPGTHAFAR